jgi:hypothetical protein
MVNWCRRILKHHPFFLHLSGGLQHSIDRQAHQAVASGQKPLPAPSILAAEQAGGYINGIHDGSERN